MSRNVFILEMTSRLGLGREKEVILSPYRNADFCIPSSLG